MSPSFVRCAVFVAQACCAVAAQAQEAAGGAGAQQRFAINEYRVLGNSALDPVDIENALYPTLGEGKTIADVQDVRQMLEKLYRDKGYGTVYVDIPEQSVEGGVVRLKVTEGRLDRVRITGARYFANGKIREELPVLEQGTVLNLPELQAQLGAVNQQSRDRSVTPVLRAGRSPGTVDIELNVKDDLPFHGSVEVNNRYSANTTHSRASILFSYDNLFQKYQSLSLQYQGSPEEPGETRVIAATYLAPLASGNLLAVYGVHTNSDFAVVSTGGDLGVVGNGNIFGARYIARLPAAERQAHSVTLGLDYKDFEDNILLPDGTPDTTPIRYLLWSAAYGGSQTHEYGTTGFNIGVNLGVRGAVNDEAEFAYKRYQGKPNFIYVRADANHTHRLWGGLGLRLRAAGQWSPEPLISNEQFTTGGADGVRGYTEAAVLADEGISGTLELQAPTLRGMLGGAESQLTVFGFLDAAYMHQILQRIEDGIAFDHNVDLMSTGAGLRYSGFGGMEASLDWAYALRSWTEVESGDSRVHFTLRYAF